MNDRRAQLEAQYQSATAKLSVLQQANPMLIDVSLREPCFSSYLGHTLQTKQAILPLVDAFGMQDKIIATLDYQDPTHPQVEDQFLTWLNGIGYNMANCFVLTAVGEIDANGRFIPDISMEKLVDYKVPNTLHEIYLMPKADPQLLMQRIGASVQWLRQRIPGRIMMNIVDLMDAFYADRDYAAAVLGLLAEIGVDGLSFEDARGSYFPFQVGAMVGAAKAMLNASQKVVFHCHSGNGMENASAIEALLAGADGYWGGMEKESSTIGHASLGELIANLVRAGNPHMAQRFQLEQLLPTCRALHQLDLNEATPQQWPISGTNAYRQILSSFDQVPGRLMDLPPEVIGERYTFRISPDGSDIPVIQGRVLEALGESIDNETADQMILLMRQDLMNGIRIRYDDPMPMRELLARARHALGQDPAPRWQTRSKGS